MNSLTAQIEQDGQKYLADLTKPLDISIPISRNEGPNAFFLGEAKYKAVEADSFTGDVRRGGSCNCEDITFNPHGNGTHTECAGHISNERIYINTALKQFLFICRLVSLSGETGIITKKALEEALAGTDKLQALIIRTLPNNQQKKTYNYSGTSPTYLDAEAITYINKLDVQHLLTDLPSLDKEDDPKLIAHHLFFMEGGKLNPNKTVTEMVFVENNIPDGLYLLNIQIASFESDASPSKPVLYALMPV